MITISRKDIDEFDGHVKKLEAANVDPAFKRKALELCRETKSLALAMLPFLLKNDEIEKEITALRKIYPQYKKYL